MQQIAYQIGAVFIACALVLLYSAFSKTFKFRGGGGIILGCGAAAIAFILWQHIPEIEFAMRSVDLPWNAAPKAAPQPPPPAPAPVAVQPKGPAKFHGTVREVPDPEPAEIAQPVQPPEPVEHYSPSEDSPYDSGIKRGLKHVGRIFHRKNTQPQP